MNDLTKELQGMHAEDQKDLAASLKEINELANEAYAAKLTASNFEQKAKDLKNKLAGLMETAGVDKISADDCTVSGKIKASASVPKDDAAKLELFKYLMSLDNLDPNGNPVVSAAINELAAALVNYPTFLSMVTVNATAFNSWYGKEQDKHIQAGEVDWSLPYVNTYEYYSVGFRKKAGK